MVESIEQSLFFFVFHLTFDMDEYNELFYHCVQVLNEYNHNTSERVFLEEYFLSNQVSDFHCGLLKIKHRLD